MKDEKEFHRIADFISGYAVRLMGSGVHTSRVVRNTMRISEALGVVTQMTLLHKTLIFSIHDKESGQVMSDVVPVKSFPISFYLNSELSSLSWAALDNHLPLEEIERRYQKIVDTPRINHTLLTFLVACANGSFCQLFGGSAAQIEYAAEMGLEHHLGMTCDPVCGLVQIPCIERNAYAAARALDANIYSSFTDGKHRVSYDRVVEVMKQTGKDIPSLYKETSEGGLAKGFKPM